MDKKSVRNAAKQEAIDQLREWIKPGDTVYTILRSVSRSGMSRHIGVLVSLDGTPDTWRYIEYLISEAMPGMYRRTTKGGNALIVEGCGMDMGFGVVYNLGRVLFPNGFGVACSTCGVRYSNPSNVESGRCRLGATREHEFHGRNNDKSGWDNDGGYALVQRWL